MSLTDLMSGTGLTVYPIAALVLFLSAFAGILWRLYRRGSASEFARHSAIPLQDDGPVHRTAPQENRP